MAKGAKVTECYLSESSDEESGDEFGPSYVKLASLATKQQRDLEKVHYMLNKSDDMLGEEMDQSKALAESLQRLHTKYDTLQDQHNTLLSDYEKLSYEFVQGKHVRTPILIHTDLACNTSYHFAASRTVFPRVSPYHGPGPFAPFGSRI